VFQKRLESKPYVYFDFSCDSNGSNAYTRRFSYDSAAATSTIETGISPAKVVNLRSNYLQQIWDLYGLYESGATSEAEFKEQKAPSRVTQFIYSLC